MSCTDYIYHLSCGHRYPVRKRHSPEETFISSLKCPIDGEQRATGRSQLTGNHTFEELNPEGKTVSVVAACYVINGKVLLQGRENENRNQEFLQFPGGKVEPGETLEEALVREIREEIGCEVVNEPWLNRYPLLVHAQINRYPPDPNDYLVLFYAVELRGTPEPIEGPLYWVPIDEVEEKNLLPGVMETLRRLL